MPKNNHAVFTGVVYYCPVMKTQVAAHIGLVEFTTIETNLFGVEVDLEIQKCLGCGSKHSILVPSN